jgi:hypothetical protein
MNNRNAIIEMLLLLRRNNIFSTDDFEKDLEKLVSTNLKTFIKNFTRDIRRKNFEQFNRYEKLSLTKKQKEEINGNDLYRYEYRKDSNLKCIYLLENTNNIKKIILLCAFNEDGDKTKGKKSYKDNINRAIRIYLKEKGV